MKKPGYSFEHFSIRKKEKYFSDFYDIYNDAWSEFENFTPIEGSERKPQHPRGRLSESTLKVMLQAQELE